MYQETIVSSSKVKKSSKKEKMLILRNLSDYKIFEKDEKEKDFYNIYTISSRYVPQWCGPSEYIIKGYRRVTNSYMGAAKSLLYLHNETGNVWTHGLGSLGFIILMIWFLAYSGIKAWRDDLVMSCFFVGAIGCLSLSTLFHLFCCHSRHVCSMWNKADYIGIVVLITGSFVPLVYYGFYCHPIHQAVYMSMILLFGAATISISVSSYFATPQYRFLRTGLFSAMGLSGIAPLVNGVLIYGYPLAKVNFAISRVILMGSLYIFGAFIYAFRVPERWWPGKFDIIGQSHQIFHILVVAGAAIHFTGVQLMQTWWLENNPQCELNTTQLQALFHY